LQGNIKISDDHNQRPPGVLRKCVAFEPVAATIKLSGFAFTPRGSAGAATARDDAAWLVCIHLAWTSHAPVRCVRLRTSVPSPRGVALPIRSLAEEPRLREALRLVTFRHAPDFATRVCPVTAATHRPAGVTGIPTCRPVLDIRKIRLVAGRWMRHDDFVQPTLRPIPWLLALMFVTLTGTSQVTNSCDPIRTFADGKQPLREIFVSPTGSNTTGDGTQANPYQTIARALPGVQPGDAIRLLPGNHAPGNSIGNFAGTAEAPIWIGGVPGQPRPVISGGGTAIQLSRIRYVILENLEVAGATANGINCDDGGDYANSNATHHVLFRNLFIHDIGTGGNNDGLKLSGLNDYFVLDCDFARMSAGGSGVDHVGCHRGLIARCTFTDAGSNSIQCKGGSEDLEIRGNRFVNGGARAVNIGGSTGFEYFRPPLVTNLPNTEARNIRVIANLFRGSETPVAFVGAVNSLVANNTIVEPTRWVLRILQETVSSGGYTFLPCGSNQFVNNLVYFDRSQISTFVNVGPNTDAASFQFANNLWYAFNQPGQSQPSLPAAETNGVYGLNPLFVSPATGDYAVATNSPAVGNGRRLPRVWADHLERCYANPPTIGAFEAKPPPSDRADADGDSMPDLWEAENGLDRDDPGDGALDADNDTLSNYGEYLAGTNPNDPQSVFALRAPQLAAGDFSFRYATVTGRTYRVQARDPATAVPWADAAVTNGTGDDVEFRTLVSTGARMFRVQVQPAE